jgi:hypothetical protein
MRLTIEKNYQSLVEDDNGVKFYLVANHFAEDCELLYPYIQKIIAKSVTHTVQSYAFSDVTFSIAAIEPNLSKLAEKRPIPFDVVRILSVIRSLFEEHSETQRKMLVHMFVTCTLFVSAPIREGLFYTVSDERTELIEFLYDITRNYKKYLPQLKLPKMYFENNYQYTQGLNRYVKRRRDILLRSYRIYFNDEDVVHIDSESLSEYEDDEKVFDYINSLPQDPDTRPPATCTLI